MDRFLYKTIRAEWWIEEGFGVLRQIKWHGPYPTRQEAMDEAYKKDTHNLQNDPFRNTFKLVYREVPVDIDPILSNAVQGIAGLVAGWFSQAKNPSNPFASRPSGYVRLSGVESSMKQLSEIILKTFEINKENPDVPESEEQV